jgi:YVTN family beta-propeller protein
MPSYIVNIMDTLAAAAGFGTDTLEVFNTGNGSAPGSPFSVPLTLGDAPFAVAVTPDGRKAYVTANGNDAIRIVDTITSGVTSIAFSAGGCTGPRGIAIALVGGTPKAFVACTNRKIAIINASTDTIISENNFGTAGAQFYGVAVTPDDAFVYVTDEANNEFVVLDAATETAIAAPFSAGVTAPHGIAINGDLGGGGGTNVYIAGSGSDDVIAISTADNTTVVSTDGVTPGVPIPVTATGAPEQITFTPDAARAYVTLNGTDEFAVIDDSVAPSLNSIVALAGGAGAAPFGVTIPPLLTVPLTGLRVFIANTGNDEIESRNDASPFAANGSSPIALTGSAPLGVAHIPVPR